MQKEIVLNGKVIQYLEKVSKKSRSIRLSVQVDGSVVVSRPSFVSSEKVANFIKEKSSWIISKLEHFKSFDHIVSVKNSRLDFKIKKSEALKFVKEKVGEFNKIYNFVFKEIKVRNQKTRWGSCSKSGTLSFNYKIIYLGDDLASYIVVHELCHLKEFNHSKKFWDEVAKVFPDHKHLRQKLRKIRFV